MKYLETVIKSGLFSQIEKSDYIYAFEELFITGRRYKKGSIIFSEGDEIKNLCIVKDGSVRSEKMYVEGDTHILSFWTEYMVFGIENTIQTTKATEDFVCHDECEVVFISWQSICESQYSENITCVLMQKIADENVERIKKVNLLSHRNIKEKIMLFLENKKESQADENGTIRINMNREQMAQYLGVNRSALSNELSNMKKEGIIDYHKNEFRIL